jgi:transposase
VSASERDEAARSAWRERAKAVDPRRWVWIDETGSHLGFTPRYSRAPRGQRAPGRAPPNRGKNRTLITALTLAGTGPSLLLEGALDRAAFDAYVTHLLAPTLHPGQIVVVDNLKAHHSDRARAAIEARGAELWFLPSYSPDLNPIEEAFSKLKALLRRAAARTHEALVAAIWAALAAITPQDAAGWFTHCGYARRSPRPRRRPPQRPAPRPTASGHRPPTSRAPYSRPRRPRAKSFAHPRPCSTFMKSAVSGSGTSLC